MDLRTLLGAASRPETEVQAQSHSQQPGTGILQQLLQLAEHVDTDPLARKIVAEGIARFIDGKGVLEGKPILSAVFAGSFQRCALLWKLFLEELDAFSCPQRLLLKLEYCQRFCIRVFSSSPLDTKRSLVSENAASITFALDLSIAVLQGNLPAEPSQLAAAAMSFFQQFHQYLPHDTAPIPPSCCQEVLTRLTFTSEPNKPEDVNAAVLILTAVVHCVSHYGWNAVVGDIDLEPFLMTMVHYPMEKLSIISKALLALMPDISCVEVLLNREQLSLLVNQLSIVGTNTKCTSSVMYSIRELLLIIKAITRVQDNSTGLLEEGVEKVLVMLMEQDDEIANAVAAEITCRIATVDTSGINMGEEEMDRSSCDGSVGTWWGYGLLQAKDTDGTIAFTDILLSQLVELISLNDDDFSAESIMTIETLLLTVFDLYWHSEEKMKNAVAELIGDKYAQHLNRLHLVALSSDTTTAPGSFAYRMLVEELARKSTYFCEKVGAGGFLNIHLATVLHSTSFGTTETTLNYSLTVLFYCAHVKMFHYFEFCRKRAVNTLGSVLESPVAHTRLLARLVICCLLPILEDCDKTLLKMTDEESQLILAYIKDNIMLPGGLDPAKFLMATSILYGDVCPQNASGPLVLTLAETVVQYIFQLHDNCILESTLCLLWTLCHTTAIVQTLSQIDHLIPELKTIEQTRCSTVSSLAKCVLWKLGCGKYEDNAEHYHYARTCLHYGRYTECIEQCDHIMTTAPSSLHGLVRQVRGKAFAHLHQNQFWHIVEQDSLDVAVPLKRGNLVDQCANSAKAAVKDLRFALDKRKLDEEGSYLMDIAMLHFVMIKHQLRDCDCCLLCRRRGMKLKESHICPKFLLKYTKEFYPSYGRFAAYTPKTATYAMLCGRCEQILSQNGEDQFQKDIMPLLSTANDQVQTVKYNSTLYSFCLGIVFRFFMHYPFITYYNASEIYSLLVACRHHLLSLPVKYSETDAPPPVASPPVGTAMPLAPVEVFLVPSPLKLHIEKSQLCILANTMTCHYGAAYLNAPLSTEPDTKGNVCHALVVHLFSCSIVVPFSPAQGGDLNENCRINPHGGEYQVLPDIEKWEILPSGLLQVFVSFAHQSEDNYQKIISGMKTTKKDSKKADAFITNFISIKNMAALEQPIDANSLQLLPPKEKKLITMFLSKPIVPANLKMLPQGFDIKISPPQVILKEGYKLLYHKHNEQENVTCFFAANCEDLTYGKLVVIMKCEESSKKVEGVDIHIREDESSCSFCVTGFLQEAATETLQEAQNLRLKIVSERIRKALNALVRKCGSLKVFLHYARLQMRMKNNPCLDKRCSLNGCWYCMDCCHICMELAIQDYTSTLPEEKLTFKHCSAQCKAIVDHVSQLSTELHPANQIKQIPNKHFVLASIIGCVASVISTHTIVQLNICISMERSSITYGRPYATVQLHTQEQNLLFSVYLSDDLSPTHPVDDFPPAFSFQMLIESKILTEIFQKSLHPLEVSSISHLLRDATKADITLAEMFSISCSPCESGLCWEETVASLNSTISQEVAFTRWMLEQVVLGCGDKKEILQISSNTNPLIFSSSSCQSLFWTCFQLICILWKRVLIGNSGLLLFQKIINVTHITVKLYEQSPSDVQEHITSAYCSSAQTLLLCGQIAITAIKGGLPLNIRESAVELLLLAHKFIAMVRTASEAMRSILVRYLYQDLEGVCQDDVQRLTKISVVAQLFLVTLMLKSHICDVSNNEAVPIQPFLNSPFLVVSIMAKAVAVSLLQCCPQTEICASDTEMTVQEVDFLVVIIHDLTEDSLKRRYLFQLILQALTLLCSQPVNADRFANHSIIAELETLMEHADELEDPDIIANVLWKIATGGGVESTTETNDNLEVLPGEEISKIDICLDIEQGLCETAERLLMIIHEFCSIYLECEHVHESYSCTVSSAAQLLCDLHQTMDKREKEAVAQFISQNTSIVIMLSLAVSKHRKSWLRCFKGIHTRGAIESLFATWTDCSEDFCQAVAESGVLPDIANSLHWALEHEASDSVSLQNQVLIIYNIARKYPKQTAIELQQLTYLQLLLNCSSPPVRAISKSIISFLADYMDISVVGTLSLTNDEVLFFTDGFASFINFGRISMDRAILPVEELLYSFQRTCSLPCDKSCCALPCLLDTLLELSSHDDKTIAKTALEVLWKMSMEPTVALAILCHENVVCTLQKTSVFNTDLADLARSILWILGYGNVQDITGCCEYATVCYNLGKYAEAILWCDHVLDIATAGHPIVSRVKSCKGKAQAQMYLHNQLQRLQRNDQWTMMGYDSNLERTELSILNSISHHPLAIDNELLIELCFSDLQNWKNLCSQGQQAIKLLGEVLDSGELDEQGSELLDWVMMDYYRESGETNDCKRCLLCRNIGELVLLVLKPTALEAKKLASESILSLHSFTHFEQSANVFMFCKECELILSTHDYEHAPALLNATDGVHCKPITYERVTYLHFIAKLARKLPLAYTGFCSNWKDIYNTFVACRQILLSHGIYNGTMYFPKIYLFNNPNTWYVLMNSSLEFCSFSSSRYITAMIPSKPSIGIRKKADHVHFFMMHIEGCSIVVDLKPEKEEGVQLPSQYLINPAGGSYPIPHVSERWEAFPQELIQAFHNLALADERRNVCQHILRLEGTDFSNIQQFSRLTRLWLPPKRHSVSFLPDSFLFEADSDTIRNLTLPDGHTILLHSHNQDKNLTIFLAYATNSIRQKKQFYFIFTCKLYKYFIAAGMFLNSDAKEVVSSSNPVLFPMCFTLPVKEATIVYQLLFQKFPLMAFLNSLRQMLVNYYASLGFEAVSTYEDITRYTNLAVSVDKKCSPEGCWYCHHRCHSCMKPASVGYTWKDGDSGQLFYHCSNRCYRMYTGDIPESTILDVKVGEIQHVPVHGAHLLLSVTVLRGNDLSTNSVVSTQVAISYGSKEVPEGVVYVITRLKRMEKSTPPIALFIQHDLTPVKNVWGLPVPEVDLLYTTMMEAMREMDILKRCLQPVFKAFACDDLPSFLEQKFPHLHISFMDPSGVVYPWPPTRGQSEASADTLMGEGGGD